jgi:hypothetical protein
MLICKACTTSSGFLLPVYHKRSYTFSLGQDRRGKEPVGPGLMALQAPLVETMSKAKYLVRVFSIFAIECAITAGGTCITESRSLSIVEEIDIANADSRCA